MFLGWLEELCACASLLLGHSCLWQLWPHQTGDDFEEKYVYDGFEIIDDDDDDDDDNYDLTKLVMILKNKIVTLIIIIGSLYWLEALLWHLAVEGKIPEQQVN